MKQEKRKFVFPERFSILSTKLKSMTNIYNKRQNKTNIKLATKRVCRNKKSNLKMFTPNLMKK